MNKIKREYSYRTTDDKLFSGQNAVQRAKGHQRRVSFRKTIVDIVPAAEEIFNLKDTHNCSEGATNEDILLDEINECLYCDVEDLEDLVTRFTNLQMAIPEFVTLLVLIKNRFKRFEVK